MRWYAQRALTGQWLHRDIVFNKPAPTWGLSGQGEMQGGISPEWQGWQQDAGDGLPLFLNWGTLLFGEESGQIRWGGIVTDVSEDGHNLVVTAGEFGVYPRGYPYEHYYTRVRVDPLDAVRHLWETLQSDPTSDLGVTVDDTESGQLVGRAGNLLSLNVATGTDELGTTKGFSDSAGTLSSSTEFTFRGSRALKINMGSSHQGGANLFRTHFVPFDPDVHYSFYGRATTGGTEPQQDYEIGVTVEYYDQNRHRLGTYVYEQNYTLPAGGDWRQFSMTGFSSAWPETAFVRMRVFGGGDDDQMSVWADDLVLLKGSTRQQVYELAWWKDQDIGNELDKLARETPFDRTFVHEWADEAKTKVNSRLKIGYPRLGRRQHNLRFVEGENVTNVLTVELNGDDFSQDVTVLGAGEGRSKVRSRVARPDGRLRRPVVLSNRSIHTVERATRLGRRELEARNDVAEVTSMVVWNHPHARLGSFGIGDDVLVRAKVGWADREIWHRITDYTYRPEAETVKLSLARSDSFTYGKGVGTNGGGA